MKLSDSPSSTIGKLIEATAIAFHTSFQRLPNAERRDSPQLVSIATDLQDSYFNGILRADLAPAELDAQIEAALAPFQRRHVPMLWHIGPSTRPANLGERLLAHGLAFHESEPGMAADLQAISEFPAPAGLTIAPVSDLDTLRTWVGIWAAGVPGAAAEECYRAFAGVRLDGALRHHLGRLNGEPVATVSLYSGAEAASVEHVSTLPHARRQGIGTAMVLKALRDARMQGYRIAVLSASPSGLPVYRRLGFREYFVWHRYMRP